jgi:ATP-dependent Lon protease
MVVFPGMTVPLHVFEERYKQLVRTVVEQDEHRFVITMAGKQAPIGDVPPKLAPVGTVVDVLSLQENTDGTFEMLVHGQERCRVEISRREEVAEIDGASRPLFFTELEPEPLRRDDPNLERVAAWDAIDSFRAYAETFFAFDAQGQIEGNVPDDPFYQASFVCANIRVPLESRQVLLEAPSLRERLELARKMMLERLAAHGPARAGDAPTEGA